MADIDRHAPRGVLSLGVHCSNRGIERAQIDVRRSSPMLRFRLLGLSLLSVCFAACGDDSGGDGGSSDKSSNLSAEELAAGGCNEDMGMDDSSECDAYIECAADSCQAEYRECLGEDYESGDFSGGACEEFISCATEADDPCENSCTPDQECTNCFISLGQCVSMACAEELEECSGASSPSGSPSGEIPAEFGDATCEDLEACCDSLSGTDQSDCNDQFMQVQAAGDLGCAAALSIYQAAQLCQ